LYTLDVRSDIVLNIVTPIEKHNTPENPSYPYLGSDEERKRCVLYFNKCIKQKCIENNWVYLDIYDSYTDENGFLDKERGDGNVHIKNGVYLKDFINRHLL
jgi:hypothetical protein